VGFLEEVNLLTRLPIVCYYINRMFWETAFCGFENLRVGKCGRNVARHFCGTRGGFVHIYLRMIQVTQHFY